MKRKAGDKIDPSTDVGMRALRKMKRLEILDIMLEQQRIIDEMKRELADTKAALAAAEKKLEDHTIITERTGSLAKAALELNGVFEAAQKAAEDYVANVKLRVETAAAEAERAAEAMKNAASESAAEAGGPAPEPAAAEASEPEEAVPAPAEEENTGTTVDAEDPAQEGTPDD